MNRAVGLLLLNLAAIGISLALGLVLLEITTAHWAILGAIFAARGTKTLIDARYPPTL